MVMAKQTFEVTILWRYANLVVIIFIIIAPIFFGGRLLALNKKSGGIRPIAIGFTLRRLPQSAPTVLASVS